MIDRKKIMLQAAVLVETGKPLVFMDDILIPELKPGQVLVKIKYAGVCHSQLMEAKGLRGKDNYLPHMLGHEGVGEVVEIGSSVSKVAVGDEVVIGWIKGSGLDAGGAVYTTKSGLQINAGGVTTFSNYAVVSENRVVKKPQNTPMDLAVLYGCAVPTGAGILLNRIKPEDAPNMTIAFFGLGGIGLSALLAAKTYDFKKIIAVDVAEEKLQLAKNLGVDHVFNALECDPVVEVMKITDDIGVDFSVEAAGLTKTIEQAYAVVKKGGGRCVFASHPKAGDKISIDPFDLICGKQIEGTWGGGCCPDRDIPKFDKLYSARRLQLECFESQKYALSEINEVMHKLENKKLVRAVIDMGV